MTFFLAGGFPMVFIVVFGLVALAGAGRFALHPRPGGHRAVAAYGAAVACAAVAGTAADLVAVSRTVATHGEEFEAEGVLARILVVGAGEALSPLVLGTAVLAVVCLGCAIGLRRLPAD